MKIRCEIRNCNDRYENDVTISFYSYSRFLKVSTYNQLHVEKSRGKFVYNYSISKSYKLEKIEVEKNITFNGDMKSIRKLARTR